ncbi:MAG: cysteine desulfurase [Clostridia bacterium]|nr:cysteine desulfurase [Clostridia bacterium]
METIYFDNSATTKMSQRAQKKMIDVINSHFANPSSLHALGFDAEKIVSEARARILTTLGIARGVKGELVFTSGGTESNNLAILGVVSSKKRKGNEKILVSAGEHSSVEKTVSRLEAQGYCVLRVPTRGGRLDLDFIYENANDVILASFMHVNNETGALYNLKEAFDIIKALSPDAVTHADCVQSYMKVRFTKKSLGADLISLSAHKINGAKGTGALYISPEIIKAKKIVPIVYGGGQEGNFRSGTENVYGIAAFGEAATEHFENMSCEIETMEKVRAYISEGLASLGLMVNEPLKHAPHIINVTIDGIRSETMLHYLSSKGIYVSSGSACASNSAKKASLALVSFGKTEDEADSSIRISLSPENTKNEADLLILNIKEAILSLQKKK